MTEIINGTLRLIGDRLLVKPLKWEPSKVLEVVRYGRPLRGEVIAVGPGANQKKYKPGPGGPKSFMDYSKRFRPTDIKVGEIVELGGLNIFDGQGYQFPEVIYNGEKHLICNENDIAIVRDDLKLPERQVPDEGYGGGNGQMRRQVDPSHARMHCGAIAKIKEPLVHSASKASEARNCGQS